MKSIKIISLLFLLFSLCTAQAKDIYVTITNPLAHERHQLVDLSVDTISAKMNVKARFSMQPDLNNLVNSRMMAS